MVAMESVTINGETITTDMVKRVEFERPMRPKDVSLYYGPHVPWKEFEPEQFVTAHVHLKDGRILDYTYDSQRNEM